MEQEPPQAPSDESSTELGATRCISCGSRTEQSRIVYIGSKVPNSGDGLDAVYTYRKEIKGICDDCVHSYQSGAVGFIFYVVLQLAWLSVAQQGLLSPIGFISAALAVFGLIRLAQKCFNEFSSRRSVQSHVVSSPYEASDAVCSLLKKDAACAHQDIRSLRDHELRGG